MSKLYNNKKQEAEFHLLTPRKISPQDCRTIKDAFKALECDHVYVIAEQTPDFNCIGWAIGVKAFLDPRDQINPHYSSRVLRDDIGRYEYTANKESCMKASLKFFDAYKGRSVLPQKDYKAVDHIPSTPQDDTIAFYFLPGIDDVNQGKGFTHAARYVKDIESWVSDLWTSKLGQYKLITHDEDDLNGDFYGDPLCYLVPRDQDSTHDEL